MPPLRSPQDLLHTIGPLGEPYFDIVPYTDGAAGFSVKRRYPESTPLVKVASRDGTPALACLIRLVVDPPTALGGVSPVRLSASLWREWNWSALPPAPDDPKAPSPTSMQLYRQSRKPVSLDFNGDFVYDTADGRFYDDVGMPVSGLQMLDYVYVYHCRTLATRFVARYRVQQAVRWLVRQSVWRGQDWCLWVLEHGYEIRTNESVKRRSPFYHFRPPDFARQTDKDGTHFFGFQSSKRSFFANVIVLAVACAATYYLVPRFGLLRAIYSNTALTTVALAFGFLVADQAVPLLLKGTVCLLSRIRFTARLFWPHVKA